jgi:hypothetical protein
MTVGVTECHGRVITLLLRNRDAPGSNLGPETGYPDRGVRDFTQSLQVNGQYVKLGHDCFLPQPHLLFAQRYIAYSFVLFLDCIGY